MQKYLTKLDQPNFLLQENDKIVSTIFKNAGGNVVNLKNENLKIFFIKISPNRGVIYLKPLKFNKKYIGNATYKMAQFKWSKLIKKMVNKSEGDGTYEELTNPSIFDNPDAQGTNVMLNIAIDNDGTPLVNLGVNYLDLNAFVNLIDGDLGVRYGNDFSGGIEKTADGWKVKFGGKSVTSTIGTDGSIEHDIHGLKIKGVKGNFGVSLSGVDLFSLSQKGDRTTKVKVPVVGALSYEANSLADRLREAFTKPSVSKQNDNSGFGGTGFSQPPSDSNNNEAGNTPTETGYTPPTPATPPTTDNNSDTNQDTTKTSWEETEGTTFGGKDLDNYWETSYEREVDENGNNTDKWKSTTTDQDGNETTEEFTDQDSDGDGVPDKDDSHPNDPERQTYMEDPIGETGGSRGSGRPSDAAQILYIMNEIEADGSKDPQKDILFDPTPDHDSGDGTYSDAAMTLFDFDDPSIDWGPNGKPAKNGDSGFEIQDFAIDWGPNGKPKNKEHDPFGIGITFPIDPKSPIMFSRLEMISNAISFINCNNTACSSLSVGSNMLNNSQLNSVFNKRFINNVVSVFK
jgi:hypothetical protein